MILGLPADRILPKLGLVTVATGWPKFVWLNRLKNSARNCNDWLSTIGMFLNTEQSKFSEPGPRSVSRPELPNVPTAFLAKANVLKYCVSIACLERLPPMDASPTWSARSCPVPLNELSTPLSTVNGRPEYKLTMP